MNKLYEDLIGKKVVVRSSPSGVWMGELVAADDAQVKLHNARRAWSWEGAASCSGLAVEGPSGGRITSPVRTVIVHDVCEALEATKEAIGRWDEVKPWVA